MKQKDTTVVVLDDFEPIKLGISHAGAIALYDDFIGGSVGRVSKRIPLARVDAHLRAYTAAFED